MPEKYSVQEKVLGAYANGATPSEVIKDGICSKNTAYKYCALFELVRIQNIINDLIRTGQWRDLELVGVKSLRRSFLGIIPKESKKIMRILESARKKGKLSHFSLQGSGGISSPILNRLPLPPNEEIETKTQLIKKEPKNNG